MACWKNKPNCYTQTGFIDIPEGDHRVRIDRVTVEKTRNGSKCFEISLSVSGYHGKLWHHIWYNPERLAECERNFYPFFYSFGIKDYDLSNYTKWKGATGAVRVGYESHTWYKVEAKYIQFLYGARRDKLPPWEDAPLEMNTNFVENLTVEWDQIDNGGLF